LPQPELRDALDSASPRYWDDHFERRHTPWDQGGAPSAFQAFATRQPRPLDVLIPGCGSAHEAHWLAERGWRVKAIDFSGAATVEAQSRLGKHRDCAEQADFFRYQPPFAPAWIYERAFLCALPLARQRDYATRMAELLTPGALLAGFFLIDASSSGPPFALKRDALVALLAPYFELVDEHGVADSIPAFAGKERWMTWRRR
jgi:trans-aconitate methyltransferase